jgi:two-component system nitrogen regulation sensor histidine kinase GlnL
LEEDLSFVVDKNSLIVSWGKKLGQVMGKSSSKALGKVYHEVFPRLLTDDKDAIASSLAGKGKIILKEYHFKCPYDSLAADIGIEPMTNVKGVNGKTGKGARVTMSNVVCPVLRNMRSAQRFIGLGKTASTLAHGVRNPLNAMKGAVLYLSEKYRNERTLVEFAEIMEDEIKRFDDFISLFLVASATEAESTVTDVNSLLKKIQVLTSYQTHFYQIRTVYEYGDIPAIMANSFQLEHAILNIINNAIEVMQGGGRLTVKTRLEPLPAGNYILIEISDTGPETAVDAVRQSAPRALTDDGGKGFGLLITREILKSYGGHLEIGSRKGKGTVAGLYIAVSDKGETQ